MKNVWVYKFDGRVQCDDTSKEIPLQKMREDLALIIGDAEIRGMEKRSLTMIQLCGMPAGTANAYEITPFGYLLLTDGIPGPQGFMLWPSEAVSSLTQNQKVGRSIRDIPCNVRELIGRPLRAYKTGDALTEDWQPSRVNIETDGDKTIIDIWFG